jgi:hypothetical protein
MDNQRFLVSGKDVKPSNSCQGTTYLNAVKWTGYRTGIRKYENWTEVDYYKELEKFTKKPIDVTTFSFHNQMFASLFKGYAAITAKPFSLANIRLHIQKKQSPVIFSIDVKDIFNPKSKEPMGHVVLGIGSDKNGITTHDPRGQYSSGYRNLDGNCAFFSNELLEHIGRKTVGIYCVDIKEKK